jgi:hypothetical protein
LLDALITSKTRIKLLLKFFLNGKSSSYLRHLETEFGESSNAIRVELNRFEGAGLLNSYSQGNRKYYQANQTHPLFPEINSILMKHVGIDKILENVIHKIGDIDRVFLTGEFAKGKDGDIIDLVFIGEKIDKSYLMKLVEKVEKLIERRVRYIVYSQMDGLDLGVGKDVLLLWKGNELTS